MIYCISVINGNEFDLSATYNADLNTVTINNFGIWPEPEFHTMVEMSYADFASFINTINSAWPAEDSEINVWRYYEDMKFVYYFDHNYDIHVEVTMSGYFNQILVFEREHIDKLSTLLTAASS